MTTCLFYVVLFGVGGTLLTAIGVWAAKGSGVRRNLIGILLAATGSYAAGTCVDIVVTGFAGAIIGYVLQVSPAPAVATFNDVPTNHLFYPYIEALVDAGITAGCHAPGQPPIYCPDAPLTRGQMAVFLAKALGLQFP